jgi:ParB family chromosome partitioning protein
VPVVVRDIDDGQALELALVENLQREDLSALEEADAYHHLIERFDYTQEALAKDLGKSRSHIANTLRLRGLPEPVKALLEQGELRAGHARALLSAEDAEALARKIVNKRLSVRQVERLIQQEKSPKAPKAKGPKSMPKPGRDKDPDTIALERDWASRSRSTFTRKAARSPSATRPWSSSTMSCAASIRRPIRR